MHRRMHTDVGLTLQELSAKRALFDDREPQLLAVELDRSTDVVNEDSDAVQRWSYRHRLTAFEQLQGRPPECPPRSRRPEATTGWPQEEPAPDGSPYPWRPVGPGVPPGAPGSSCSPSTRRRTYHPKAGSHPRSCPVRHCPSFWQASPWTLPGGRPETQ